MHAILVTSTAPHSGKSGIALALIHHLREHGFDVGYFKPFGVMPVTVDGVVTDEDAVYVSSCCLDDPAPLEDVCPVVRTQAFVEDVLAGAPKDRTARVLEAYERCSQKREVMVIEGPNGMFQGRSAGIDVSALTRLLDARALVIHRPAELDLPDDVLTMAATLGERLGAVLLNWVREPAMPFVSQKVAPFLERAGVPVAGILAYDPLLSSVSVAEIVDTLGGRVLNSADQLGRRVESFMIGAMEVEQALRFFQHEHDKAVVTGGDRADVQMAALETSTSALILTGNMDPSPRVVARAEELGVPVVLVQTDTLDAIESLESLIGHVRLHDPEKAARIRSELEGAVDMDALLSSFGITSA